MLCRCLALYCHLHYVAFTTSRWLSRVLRFLNFRNHGLESLGHVLIEPRTSFRKAASEFFRQSSSLIGRNLPLLGLQIAFVSNNDQWNPLNLLTDLISPVHWRKRSIRKYENTHKMVKDLVSNDLDHIEGLLRCDRIDQHVAMDANEMFRIHDAVLILETTMVPKMLEMKFAGHQTNRLPGGTPLPGLPCQLSP